MFSQQVSTKFAQFSAVAVHHTEMRHATLMALLSTRSMRSKSIVVEMPGVRSVRINLPNFMGTANISLYRWSSSSVCPWKTISMLCLSMDSSAMTVGAAGMTSVTYLHACTAATRSYLAVGHRHQRRTLVCLDFHVRVHIDDHVVPEIANTAYEVDVAYVK